MSLTEKSPNCMAGLPGRYMRLHVSEANEGALLFPVSLPSRGGSGPHVGDGAERALAVQERLERVGVGVLDQADDDDVITGRDQLLGAADEPLAPARQPGRAVVH